MTAPRRAASAASSPETPKPQPSARECFRVHEVASGAVVLTWRLAEVSDWTAPTLGKICKGLLNRKGTKGIFFDFSAVEHLSTTAIATLVRLRNVLLHLNQAMALVAGPCLKRQLAEALVDDLFDIHDSLAPLVGREVRFEEHRTVANRGSPRSRGPLLARFLGRLLIMLVWWASLTAGLAQNPPGRTFPPLLELERMVFEAPDLRALQVEMEKQKTTDRWGNKISVYAGYSLSLSSTSFVALSELGLTGGAVLGVSVSVPLNRLLGQRRTADLDLELKLLEYELLFQQKLSALRRLYGQRQKLIAELDSLEAGRHAAHLKLEKVRMGLALMKEVTSRPPPPPEEGPTRPLFDRIDLAEAEERLAARDSQKRQTQVEIRNLQTQMWGLLGKGRLQP